MTRDEYLREMARLYREWSARYADQIPNRAAELGYDRPGSDFSIHHAIMSATSEETRWLDDAQDELTARYQSPDNPDRGR